MAITGNTILVPYLPVEAGQLHRFHLNLLTAPPPPPPPPPHIDHLQCHQWWQSWHHDVNFTFSLCDSLKGLYMETECLIWLHKLPRFSGFNSLKPNDADNGLLPVQWQAIIWTKAGLLSNGPLGTHYSEILIKIQMFSFKKIHLKMSSAK